MRFNLYEYKIDAVYKDEEETSFIMFEKSIFKIVDYLISNKDITKINKITKLKDGTHWSLKDFNIKEMRSLRNEIDDADIYKNLQELTDNDVLPQN